MTNAEKYLKNGTATEELIGEMETSLCVPYYEVAQFWNKTIKPTLTEDERVILRNMENRKYIYRDDYGHLYVYENKNREHYHVMEYLRIEMYDHLFQFIKERRRILY